MTERMGNEIDCACVIHGDYYQWHYVEVLYSMLRRNFSYPVKLHVFTEPGRQVPDYLVKHPLTEWPNVGGKRSSWWYKLQLFEPGWINKSVLYLDLDVVITANLDWVLALNSDYFWAIHDFKRLHNPNWRGINSSVMWFNPKTYSLVWDTFCQQSVNTTIQRFNGDQDFIDFAIDSRQIRYIDNHLVRSWRWEIFDGGFDTVRNAYRLPGKGAMMQPGTSIVVFHGTPKPHEINDKFIQDNWV